VRRAPSVRWPALLLALALTPASAGTLGEDAARECRARGVPRDVCDRILAIEDGLARPGASAGDLSGDGSTVELLIADFYFKPRLAIVRDGQTVVFRNNNAPGGNRHSFASADWGSNEPVYPIPVSSFGGGRAFRSGVLDPQTTFTLTIDVATMNPDAYLPLPNGDVVIGYFCYIHGASQMSGQLLVSTS